MYLTIKLSHRNSGISAGCIELIFIEDVLDAFDFEVISLTFGDFFVDACADSDVSGNSLSTLGMHCGVAVVDCLRNL